LGLPEEVKAAIRDEIEECDKYPDPFCRELVSALSEYENVDEKYLLCSNGAAEIIFRLSLALKPKKALIFAPTFADYEKALHTVECVIEYYLLEEENEFCVMDNFLEKIDKDTDIIIICNPNNPTGQLCRKDFLKKVLDRARENNTFVMVDECFMEFVDEPQDYTVKEFLKYYENLLILKAFTKIFAMPGLRLGYGITSNYELIEKMRLCGQDWSVSNLAQTAGICALKQEKYLAETKQLIKTEKKYLINNLEKMGFVIVGSKANYVFLKANNIAQLEKKLLSKGILIRSCSNYINLNAEFYRVAVKNSTDNKRLIKAIGEVMKNENSNDSN